MALNINGFLEAVDRWGERVGDGRDHIFTVVLIAIGRFLDGSIKSKAMSTDELIRQFQSGEHSREYRADFEAKLRRFLRDTGVQEPFLIIAVVRYVEWFLDDALENTAKRRRESEEKIQRYRDMLSDPEAAKQAAERQNQFRFPGMPEQTVEDVYESLDLMEEQYAGPRSLEDLKRNREELETWRSIVVPILQV